MQALILSLLLVQADDAATKAALDTFAKGG